MSPTRVLSLYRYPVKSMGGDEIPSALLTERGIPGDRCWTLRDEERGGTRAGKRFASVLGLHARLLAEPDDATRSPPVRISTPDGATIDCSAPDVNARLSDAVGAPVSLWPLLPGDAAYRRQPPRPGTPAPDLAELFARVPGEPMPDFSQFPAELFEYESPPGTYFDAFPLLIMTTASLASLQRADRERTFDIRRFRPNILLETDATGYPEADWRGRAQLGEAVVEFAMACPRCVMTTHGFLDLPKDPGIMRTLVRESKGNLGVYARVVTPGRVSVGDILEPLPQSVTGTAAKQH